MKFVKKRYKTKLKNPFLNFSIDEQEIEIRKDPLTGKVCRLNVNRIRRARPGLEKDGKFFKATVKNSKKNCPFCADKIFKLTPKFVGMKERFILKDSVLFPNLYPFSFYHAVVVFTSKKHFLSLEELTPKLLFNSLKNSLNFFKEANRKNKKFKYPSINFNYMPPAGASIVHPHFQIVLDDKPTPFTDLLIKKSLAYYKTHNSNFWFDLIKEEKKNKERFIGRTGCFYWIADFAPLKDNQVSGIISKKVSCVTELKDKQLKDLSLGLSKVFKKFWLKGIKSLNLALFSGPMGKDMSDYFCVNLKIISRPRLTQSYVSDIGFMELLHSEPVIDTLPEELAKSLRFS